MRSTIAILTCLFLSAGCGGETQQTDTDYVERMTQEHADETPVANPMSADAPDAQSESVHYATVQGREANGYLTLPAEPAGAPGILVIHEWWGLNDNIRAMADKLAAQGYAALAVDLYGGGVATDSTGARKLMQAAMADETGTRDNLRQAYRYLERQVGSPKIGTIGWCFGGGWSLQTAMMLPDEVDATVIYYGRVETDADKLRPLQTPILGLFGAQDRGIPVDGVKAFQDALATLGKEAQIEIYADADHAFANPSGGRYNAQAAEDAWAKTVAFFARNLKP